MVNTDELLSIKAFASLAGRSQQTIYKQINTRLAEYVHEKDGQKWIERRALVEVFKIGDNQPVQPKNNPKTTEENNVDQRLYDAMQTTIDLLQEQIRVKDEQINELNLRLKQALELGQGQVLLSVAEKQQLPPVQDEIQEDSAEQEVDPDKKPGVFGWFKNWWRS